MQCPERCIKYLIWPSHCFHLAMIFCRPQHFNWKHNMNVKPRILFNQYWIDIQYQFRPTCTVWTGHTLFMQTIILGRQNKWPTGQNSNDQQVRTQNSKDQQLRTQNSNDQKVRTQNSNDQQVRTQNSNDQKVRTQNSNDQQVRTQMTNRSELRWPTGQNSVTQTSFLCAQLFQSGIFWMLQY